MATTAGELSLMISIGARDSASSVMAAVGMAASKLASGDVLGAVAVAGVAAGAAIVSFGVSSVKAAGNFQQGMTMLSTSAGESKDALGMVGDGIKKIAVDTGTSTESLTKAMYQVESSGSHGAAGLQILGVAAKGAKTENADLTVVAKALTTLLTDYHMSADKATSGMNGLIKAVSNGKTTLQDMSSAMGQVLPIASSMGISFPQVAGAISTLTNAGVPAEQAAQNLAHVLVALNAPSNVAVKAMKSVGLSAQDVKDTLVNQGLPQALQLIEDHVGKKFPAGSVEAETALKNIMGGLVGLKLAAALTGGSLKEFQANVDSTAKAMGDGSKEVAGWDLVQQNLNFQLDRAKAAFEVLQITIGQKLLPIITPLVKTFVDFLSTLNNMMQGISGTTKAVDGLTSATKPVTDVWTKLGKIWADVVADLKPLVDFLKAQFATSLKEIGDIVKSTLVPAWNDFVKSIGPAIPALKLLAEIIIGAIVIGLIAWLKIMEGVAVIIILVLTGVTRLAQGLMILIDWITQAGKAIVSAFQAAPQFFDDLGKKIQDTWNGTWKWVIDQAKAAWKAVQDTWGEIGQWFQDRWKGVQSAAKLLWDNIVKDAKQGWANLVGLIQAGINSIVGFFKWLYDHDYYFKDLVDFAKKTFSDGIQAIQTNWDSFSKWWNQYWSDRQKDTQKATDAMKVTTDKWGQDTSKKISSDWDGISKNLSKTWDTISNNYNAFNQTATKAVQDTTDKVVKFFADMGKNALKAVQDGLNSIGNAIGNFWSSQVQPALAQIGQKWNDFWNSVAQNAKDIGMNIMKAIADGVKSGAGMLGTAVHDAVSMALGAVGLHNIPGFAGGVENFVGGWAVVGEKGPELMFLPSGSTVIPSGQSMPGITTSSSSSGGDQPQNIYIMLDGRLIGKTATKYLQKELHIQAGIRGA